MQPTELTAEQLRAIRARQNDPYSCRHPQATEDVDALIAHADALKAKIESAHEVRLRAMSIDEGKISMTVASDMVHMMGACMAEFFIGTEGAVNYVEMRCESTKHLELGPLVLTLRRQSGKTPHDLRLEAEAHADALAAKVARLESRWQKDAMQIDTDMDDLREERDDALAKFATTETLCDSLKAKVARLEGELEKATDALTETCDMIKCPICEEWTDPSSLCDGDGDFEPMCDSCYGAATHECSECSFRPGKPDDFDVCPMCEGEIVERPKEDSAHVAHD